MDSMSDILLNPKNVEYLLPPDIFEELFSESIPPEDNQSRPDNSNTNIVKGLGDGVLAQAASSANSTSTHLVPTTQGSQKKVAPVQRTYTWAQIAKKEPLVIKEPSTNTNGKLKGTGVPESATSCVKNQKPKAKGSSQNLKADQSGYRRKSSGKNKQGHQKTNSYGKGKKK